MDLPLYSMNGVCDSDRVYKYIKNLFPDFDQF